LGFQILLFKINYDLQIQGIIEQPTIPPDLPLVPHEVSTRPYKVFAFADDANALLKLEVSTLNRLKSVLDEFGRLSGLEFNVEKTTLLQVGSDIPLPDEIIRCRFTIVDEVTVLGVTLSGSGADTAGSITEISNKLTRQVNYWSRFNLSLPGRITVAKSMMYSQINYLGCFLHLPERVIESYSSIIERYVSGKLNIAKNRLTESIEMGGLGLFDLTTFLDAQRVAWVKRAKSLDDWWKLSLYSRSMGDVFNVRSKDFNMEREPCLYTIVKSYEKFLVNFTKHGNNYKKAYLFSNNALNLGLRDRRVVDKNLFTAALFADHGQSIKKLLIYDFLNEDGTYINRENFVMNTGIPLPLLTFQQLRGVVDTTRIRYHSREGPEMVSVDIRTFVNRSRAGSKGSGKS
jgi:hypothetical protein